MERPAATKRAANAILRRSAWAQAWAFPYYCECDDEHCVRTIWLDAAEYDRLRRRGAILAPAEPAAA